MLNQATLNVGVCATALAGAATAAIAARTRSAPARAHTFSDMGSLSLSRRAWLLLSHAGRWVVVISRGAGRRLNGKRGATAVSSGTRKFPNALQLSSVTASVIDRRFRHSDHRSE